MNNRIYLSEIELVAVLNKLNTAIDPEKAKDYVASTYIIDDETIRRHSYAHIGEYVKSNTELDKLYSNLDDIIESCNENEVTVIKIIFKLKDHLEIEAARAFERDEINEQIEDLKELKSDVEKLQVDVVTNITELKNIQSDITKEVVGISTVFITIITFILGNIGALQLINQNTFLLSEAGTTLLEFLFQVNAAIITGVSTLMIIVGSFIHKGSDGKYIKTPKLWVPAVIIIITNITLYMLKTLVL